MKRNFLWFLSFALLSTALTLTSCDDDPCKDVTCGDHSACFEGDCICDVGYEKDAAGNCVSERVKFLGTWSASDNCSSSGTATYITVTSTGTSEGQVSIANFWGLFTNAVSATISGDTITIARQEPDGDGYFVEGTGTFSNGQINWTFKVTEEAGGVVITTDNCTSVWSK